MREKIRAFLKRVWGYITATPLRRVFFYSIFLGTGLLLLGILTRFDFLSLLGMACFIISAFASLLSTLKKRAEFAAELEKRKVEKLASVGRDVDTITAKQLKKNEMFSAREKYLIKKKKREFQGNVLLRIMFIVILLVIVTNFL